MESAACVLIVLLCCLSVNGGDWKMATATWYGSPDGAGTDGGACGYGILLGTPYGFDVGAGSPVLFKNGEGCGECYELKCSQEGLCSTSAVVVAITDECPGGYCASGRTHFDLSGSAFGKMAASGKYPQLLGSGVVQVMYKRVDCNYRQGIAFQVNQGSSPFWFSVLVRYEDGPGDLGMVELMQAGSGKWQPMNHIWGANWCLNSATALEAPFSLRVTPLSTNQALVALNVVPRNWYSNATYATSINFQPSGESYDDFDPKGSQKRKNPGSSNLVAALVFLLVVFV